MVLPSLRSTASVASVTATFAAIGPTISFAEVLIPCLAQAVVVFEDDTLDLSNLGASEAVADRDANRVQPEFSERRVALNVHVTPLACVT
jgi:hypothetical protein